MDVPYVATWNTLGAGNTNSKIKEGLNSLVNRTVDVICLQEMSDDGVHNAARDYLNTRGFQKVTSNSAVPIFVRKSTWQIVDQGDVLAVDGPKSVEDGTGGSTFGDKHLVWVKIKNVRTGKFAYVANHHLYPGIDNGKGGFTTKTERARWARVQMNAAITLTAPWRASKAPVFVTGDYNLNYASGSELVTKMKSAGFVANWQTFGAKATHTTRTIDYVWYANATAAAQVLPGKYGSDHAAVLVSFASAAVNSPTAPANNVTGIGAQTIAGSTGLFNVANGVVAQNSVGNIWVMGQQLRSNLREAVVSANISGGTTQVTQLTIDLVDPGYKIMTSGLFAMGTPVRYQDLSFVVSGQATKTIAGSEGFEVTCRPKAVSDLKRRRGAKVMANSSPSDFVVSECKAVGVKYHVQTSAIRSQVARDVPAAGERYEQSVYPSSWTTFQRLASELGYICFEVSGVVHFGKPSYFLDIGKNSPVKVHWTDSHKADPNIQAEEVPTCTRSEDSTQGVTVSVKLPPERSPQFRVGRAMLLSGISSFYGYYLIDSINFSLAGTNRLTVTASTAVDPVAQDPMGTGGAGGTTGTETGAQIINETIANSWPLPTKYKVTTKYGVRGSWAAGFHTGADFACPNNTPVYAVYDGKIIAGSWGGDYGTHMILEVGTKQYAYCHLSRKTKAAGQSVKAGEIIGYSGSTGRVTGPHLHLELRYKPFKYNNVCKDPIPTLLQGGSPSSGVVGSTRLLALLAQAGFTGTGLKIAAGVAWGESNLNAKVLGDTTITTAKWGPSVGLFQIRSLKRPQDYSGNDAKRIQSKLVDPLYNAKLAYAISGGGKNWGAWTIYNNGAYKRKYGVDGTITNVPAGYGKAPAPVTKPAQPSGPANSKRASDMVTWALSRVGISRYVYGATRDTSNKDLRVFDCSSLVRWACARVGVYMPYNTRDQEPYLKGSGGTSVSLDRARSIRGALFYKSRVHVAISLGNGKTVEASTPSLGIRTATSFNRGFNTAYTIDALNY